MPFSKALTPPSPTNTLLYVVLTRSLSSLTYSAQATLFPMSFTPSPPTASPESTTSKAPLAATTNASLFSSCQIMQTIKIRWLPPKPLLRILVTIKSCGGRPKRWCFLRIPIKKPEGMSRGRIVLGISPFWITLGFLCLLLLIEK
ncbi:hypothetical protein ACOSQ2_014317 [Xanthoceras sorbifolium]